MADNPNIVSSANIMLGVDSYSVPISEIKSVTSSVEKHELLFCDERGNLNHTKQYGKTVPPSVTLTSPLIPDFLKMIYAWHKDVLAGHPEARRDAHLSVMPKGGQYKIMYQLLLAWPTKIDLGNVKAGATESGQINFTLECDHIDIIP
jgi:hypothetical protein